VFFRASIGYHRYMMSNRSRNPIPFDRPATYQITVQGRIDPTWSDRLEGMLICETMDQTGTTTMEGELGDQTALAGVLNTLYELHLSIISVIRQKID
jgi:hypothetical protein